MTFYHDKTKMVQNGFGHRVKVVYTREKTIGFDRMVKIGEVCQDCKRVKIDGYEMVPLPEFHFTTRAKQK